MTLASGEASAAGQQRVEVKLVNSCQAVRLCSVGWLVVKLVLLDSCERVNVANSCQVVSLANHDPG